MCYFELCSYQTLPRNDLSQKVIVTRKDRPANDRKQLAIKDYLTGLAESSRADTVNISYLLTL